MTVPLRDGALLAGKTTRITLVWSAMKSGWADQAVGLRVNGSKWAIGQTRPTQPSVVGRTISIDVPAVSVRKSDRLRIEVFVGERKEGRGQASWARADALKLEVRP